MDDIYIYRCIYIAIKKININIDFQEISISFLSYQCHFLGPCALFEKARVLDEHATTAGIIGIVLKVRLFFTFSSSSLLSCVAQVFVVAQVASKPFISQN